MHQRQMNPVDVQVDHIKLVGCLGYGFQQQRRYDRRVKPWTAQPGGSGMTGTSLARVTESPLANSVAS